MKKIQVLLCLFVLIIFLLTLTGCFTIVQVGDRNNPINVESALESIEDFSGNDVYITCYPIAYKTWYSFVGTKSVTIFFSDSYENALGDITEEETEPNGCLRISVPDDSSLAQYIQDKSSDFSKGIGIVLVCSCKHDESLGYYYDYVESYEWNRK